MKKSLHSGISSAILYNELLCAVLLITHRITRRKLYATRKKGKGRKEIHDESKIIRKTDLREMQSHQEKRQHPDHLRESKTQTETGLINTQEVLI